MMGMKERNFSPLPDLSLDELVPEDNFYRRSAPVAWPYRTGAKQVSAALSPKNYRYW